MKKRFENLPSVIFALRLFWAMAIFLDTVVLFLLTAYLKFYPSQKLTWKEVTLLVTHSLAYVNFLVLLLVIFAGGWRRLSQRLPSLLFGFPLLIFLFSVNYFFHIYLFLFEFRHAASKYLSPALMQKYQYGLLAFIILGILLPVNLLLIRKTYKEYKNMQWSYQHTSLNPKFAWSFLVCMIVSSLIFVNFKQITLAVDSQNREYLWTLEKTKYRKANFLKNADIIAQETISRQANYIKIITKSHYTHVGLVEMIGNTPYVIEAVEPIKRTSLKRFIARGMGKKFSIYRIQNISDKDRKKIVRESKKFLGKHYDKPFSPTDKRIYCSELVYKAAKRAIGLEIGEKENMQDLVGTVHEILFKKVVQKRWGGKIPPWWVITPASLLSSNKLKLLVSNF
ncbi:MAG: YiiX/YebB-like N1pC/P60 family cysteine hydrolase [Spirochaetota bacterium]